MGEVILDAHPGDASRAAALGEVPFAYEVELVMDGSVFRASASWPADEFPDHPGYVPLSFEPELPALAPREPAPTPS